jgi:hypothetical protein
VDTLKVVLTVNLIRFLFSIYSISCTPDVGNVAAGVGIAVAGFAAGIGMVAFAEAQVSFVRSVQCMLSPRRRKTT